MVWSDHPGTPWTGENSVHDPWANLAKDHTQDTGLVSTNLTESLGTWSPALPKAISGGSVNV